MVEQVFLLMGGSVDAYFRYTMHSREERGGQRAKKIFSCLNFSCLAIKI